MVGSAVEYAAAQHAGAVKGLTIDHNKPCPAMPIDFKKIFLAGEAEDDQENSLATVLAVLRARWPKGCQAKNVASYASREGEASIEFAAALEAASGKGLKSISSTTVAWRLKAIADAPIKLDHGPVPRIRLRRCAACPDEQVALKVGL
jgi:hypothetical protein